MKTMGILGLLLMAAGWVSCSEINQQKEANVNMNAIQKDSSTEIAVLGAGCFWCVEAIFQDFKGVIQVESGYANGNGEKPTYKEVCTGQTGYAEVIEIKFDPSVISYEKILEIFWHAHSPTTLNRQGADIGTQYRSGVYYLDDLQRETALKVRDNIASSGLWDAPIVTEIEPLKNYYKAEDYHQNYFNENPEQGYCSVVIAPKVAKIRKAYSSLLKSNN